MSQESHAIFYTTGIRCRGKEERAGFNPAELPRKKNLRKKNLPARIVEQAGVPKDRVIELSRKRILIAHVWSMLFHLLSREGIYHQRNVCARSAELLSLETGLIRDDSGNG